MTILGISAYYHDAAAALVRDGVIVAAAQEERFSRVKHDARFPRNAIAYCLKEARAEGHGLDAVVFYEKPILKFTRILQSFCGTAPRGLRQFMMAVPLWMRQKLWIPYLIDRELASCGVAMPEALYFTEHHQAHAASAFFPSPFERAAILTLDGVGEWATATIAHGRGNHIDLLREIRYPHSLGLLYSAFTFFCGFKVNSGEYKLMGLAPYGEPRYADLIRKELIDLRTDGSFHLNLDYFGFLDGLTMTNRKFERLFGGPARAPESEITRREMDLARSIQTVTEDIILAMARHAHALTGERYLCMAGGVALNCVANGRVLRDGPFADVWIQPAAGDAGGALGAALFAWHQIASGSRSADNVHDAMQGAYLGPGFSDDEIGAFLSSHGYPARTLPAVDWARDIARIVAEGKVVGILDGRMEFGPRALGNRSIVGDARSTTMQSVMNLKIKFRESFRPFAPSCLVERTSDFFELDRPSPYMLLVAPVKAARRTAVQDAGGISLRDRVHQARSDVPAITHLDYSARIQTVDAAVNPRYHALIKAFEDQTGYGIVVNTSFNVRGEPIVCSPADAYRCFMRTEMDCLVLGSFLLDKNEQPEWKDKADWRREYVLD